MKYNVPLLLVCSIVIANNLATQHESHEDSRIEQFHAYEPMMHGMYGRFYKMTRESSGTSWLPESTPFLGFFIMKHNWMMMFEGFSYTVFDKQGGKRGDKKLVDTNMFMFMLQRDVTDQDTFAIRTMFSLEPLTVGKCGYPLLFQTGETCDGKTPLIDRQHPHDLFMELALVLSHQIREKSSLFFYFGIPGEPAIGPPTFMHRYSALFNPEAPLGHHWMDSTHITFGVATMGCIFDTFKLEASAFTGHEPDEERFNFDKPRFDSFSLRLSWNPTENLAFQTSYAFLNAPEQLEPEVNTKRYTISAFYNKRFDSGNCQTAFIIGINNNKPGNVLPAFLFESTCSVQKHTLFFRFEALKNDDLFIEQNPLAEQSFWVTKGTGGYIYEFYAFKHLSFALGALFSGSGISTREAKEQYGHTFSYMIFLQLRLI